MDFVTEHLGDGGGRMHPCRMTTGPSGSETEYLHADALETTTAMTNQSDTLEQDSVYLPWGDELASSGSRNAVFFAGMRERDGVTQLDRTPARDYSSALGRWLSPDPLGGDMTDPQSLNRYAYVTNNPTTFIDPLGLSPCDSANPPKFCDKGWARANDDVSRLEWMEDWVDYQVCVDEQSLAACNVFFGLYGDTVAASLSGLYAQGGGGLMSGDFGAGLPVLPTGIPDCGDFGDCGPGIGSGFAAAAVLGDVGEGLGDVACPWCAIGLLAAPWVAQGVVWGYQNWLAYKEDIQQNLDAARIVSREPGCRAPEPDDFNTVHEIIQEQKGPDGLVSWETLLEAWREVLCQ